MLLLSAGCDPSVKDIHGNLAVHYAAGNRYRGVLEAIEKMGDEMKLLDGSGRTAIEWAKEKGEMELVRVLKRKRMAREDGGRGRRRKLMTLLLTKVANHDRSGFLSWSKPFYRSSNQISWLSKYASNCNKSGGRCVLV